MSLQSAVKRMICCGNNHLVLFSFIFYLFFCLEFDNRGARQGRLLIWSAGDIYVWTCGDKQKK